MAVTPLEDLVMDRKGRAIVEGARVYVRPRPAYGGCGELPGFGGIVDAVHPDRVTLIEFNTFNTRDVRPGDVSVQSGDTKASRELRASMALSKKERAKGKK